nr:hypothetical protein [Tanacetum cinerariifolium]
MDDPNITMEKYIRLNEEKARRHGRTFNWQTATFEKVKDYEDEDDCSIDFKTEFPAIVFDNIVIPSETTVCPPNESKFDVIISLDESDDEDYMKKTMIVTISIHDNFHRVMKLRKDIASLPPVDERHPWLRYKVKGYTSGIVQSYEQRLDTIWSRPQVFVSHAWRKLFEIRAPFVREFILEFLSTCRMSDTVMDLDAVDTLCFQLGGGLRDYCIDVLSDRDFLGPVPSYVLIRDPVRRLCHNMIAYSISGRGQTPEKGRKSKARLSGGHFIGSLAMHFRLVSDEGLRGLQVAQGLDGQQATAAGTYEDDEAGPAAEEVAEEIPAPAQLMDASDQTYHPFKRNLLGSSGLSFQRRIRLRTGDASTFAAPYTDAQPDP